MLDPNRRSLLVDSLRPPSGYVFAGGLATTFTLDLTTLLAVPLHLALRSSEDPRAMLQDGVALLESLRRTAGKLSIFCQEGRIVAPNLPHVLYGLLEPCVVEVNPPNGGVFHPKLWVIRFTRADDSNDVRLRLLVLSRNLTNDRSWDLSLSLDGVPGKRTVSPNKPLSELIAALPGFAKRKPLKEAIKNCANLADEVRRATWDELPDGFDELEFHVLGMSRQPWRPANSNRLAVLSPFVSSSALSSLAATTNEAVVLVSRPDELARASKPSVANFAAVKVLHENAETEDGDDASAADRLSRGLHAKAYITENAWNTTIFLGSANATHASLIAGANIELLAELTGKRSRVGGIDTFLGEEGLREYLVDFTQPAEPPPLTVEEQAEKLADAARAELMAAGLRLACVAVDSDVWDMRLTAERTLKLKQIRSIRSWPISLRSERAIDALPLATMREVTLPGCATVSITGLIAFEITTTLCERPTCFVLNLPVDNMPSGREAAVLRTIVENRAGFLRYLLLLLQEMDGLAPLDKLLTAMGGSWNANSTSLDGLPLLEELTRAYSRDPSRLRAVRRLIEQLSTTPEGKELLPPDFMELWNVFDSMLEDAAT